MKILVLGATGMLGSAVFKLFFADSRHQVWGTLRSARGINYFGEKCRSNLICNVDVSDTDTLISVLRRVQPEVVINCVGVIKQLENAKDPLSVLPINSILPHRLTRLCALSGARLVHISTDCVFSGRKGMYIEKDTSDAEDLYGKSKFIGEVRDEPNAITLRTSIIGHELNSQYALIEWFLAQKDTITGYEKAIFSGLPTIELARVILEYVLPMDDLHGLYHVSADPIDKCTLLRLVAKCYDKDIQIVPDKRFCIDRSLDSSRFQHMTGYKPPSWPELICLMHGAS